MFCVQLHGELDTLVKRHGNQLIMARSPSPAVAVVRTAFGKEFTQWDSNLQTLLLFLRDIVDDGGSALLERYNGIASDERWCGSGSYYLGRAIASEANVMLEIGDFKWASRGQPARGEGTERLLVIAHKLRDAASKRRTDMRTAAMDVVIDCFLAHTLKQGWMWGQSIGAMWLVSCFVIRYGESRFNWWVVNNEGSFGTYQCQLGRMKHVGISDDRVMSPFHVCAGLAVPGGGVGRGPLEVLNANLASWNAGTAAAAERYMPETKAKLMAISRAID